MRVFAAETSATYEPECLQVDQVPHSNSRDPDVTHRVVALAVSVVAGLAAPLAYGFGVYGAAPWAQSEEIQHHIALLSLCNFGCLLFACLARGQMIHKIQKTLTFSMALYGLLAFTVMEARLYFSRPAISASFVSSVIIGLVAIAMTQRLRGTRIAVMGPGAAIQGVPRHGQSVVTDPHADLSKFDVVLVDFSAGLSREWAQAASLAALAGCEVRDSRHYTEEAQGKVAISEFDVAHVSGARLASYRLSKRALDLLLVIFIAPVAIPTLLIAMAAILITMGRPVFFVQHRVGLAGKAFRMWKLRTMHIRPTDAKQIATITGDPRITPLGAFLRRFRIDELPQLFNVIRGDMSLIGPRPEQPMLAAEYAGQLDGYIYRHLVRPGITGWAQVRAGYAADVHETRIKLAYDLYYVKNFSLALDLEIVARTFWTLASGSGVR